MNNKNQVVQMIQDAFHETGHPGDSFLVGSCEGCEPFEVIEPFKGFTDWSQVPSSVLDDNAEALSFFFGGGIPVFSAGLSRRESPWGIGVS